MLIVAVDQSLCNTGVSARSGESNEEMEMHSITTKPKGWDSDIQRKLWVVRQIKRLLKGADLLVMEEYARRIKNSSSLIPLVELGGLIKRLAYVQKIPLLVVNNSQRMKFATGKGNAPKELIIKEVYKRWRFDTNDNNAADAFILGLIGYYYAQALKKRNPKAFIQNHASLITTQKQVLIDLLTQTTKGNEK